MQVGNIELNYKMLPKQELFHLFTSLQFSEFTPYLTCMTEDLVERYLNIVETIPNYVLFGGARGPGKSHAISGEGIIYALIFPGSRVGIFRRGLNEVKKSILSKMNKILPQSGNYNNKNSKKEDRWWKYKTEDAEGNRVYVLDNGSKIFINYCDTKADLERYRGDEYDLICIDEETQFDDEDIQFIKTTNRNSHTLQKEDGSLACYPNYYWASHPDVVRGKKTTMDRHPKAGEFINYPSLFRTSCNPGNIGHKRVRDIVYGTELGTKTFVKVTPSIFKGRADLVEKIVFIQGYLSDNPFLESSYELQFRDLSPEKRLMELKGEWDTPGDNFFDNFDEDMHVIEHHSELYTPEEKREMENNPTLEIPTGWKVWAFFDKGYHDAMPIQFYAETGSGDWVCFKEKYMRKLVIEQIADLMDKETATFRLRGLVCPPDMMRRGNNYYNKSGEVVGETQMEYLQYRGYPTMMANNDRYEGWEKCLQQLYIERDEDTKEYIGKPRVYFSKSCVNLIAGLNDTMKHPKNSKEIADNQEDHSIDCFRYQAMTWNVHIRKTLEEKQNMGECGKIYRKALKRAGNGRRIYSRPY